MAAVPAENFPAGQGVGGEPGASQTMPMGQPMQCCVSPPSANVPAGHTAVVGAPAKHDLPGAHSEHAVWPEVEKRPAGHAVGAESLAVVGQNDAEGHSVQVVCPVPVL